MGVWALSLGVSVPGSISVSLHVDGTIFKTPKHSSCTCANTNRQEANNFYSQYPNDYSKHVVSVDVLSRSVDADSGVLRTERLICCRQAVPRLLLTTLGGSEFAYFREISEIDPATRKYTATSYNLSFANMIRLEETCILREDPADASRTVFEQRLGVATQPILSAVGRLVEDFCVNRFESNAHLGRRGLEQIVEGVVREAELTIKKVGVEASELVERTAGSIVREVEGVVTELSAVEESRLGWWAWLRRSSRLA